VREDASPVGHQPGAVPADGAAGGQVLGGDGVGLAQQGGLAAVGDAQHAVHGPAQVDRGGPRRAQVRDLRVEGGRLARRQRHAIGRRAADGRRAAHHHVADGGRALARRPHRHPLDRVGQLALVEQHQRAVLELQGLDAHGALLPQDRRGRCPALTGSGPVRAEFTSTAILEAR
jgi:hypothetical protein